MPPRSHKKARARSRSRKRAATPGPPTIDRAVRAGAKAAARAAVTAIAGKGDYVPSRYQRIKGRGDYAADGASIGRAIGSAFDIGVPLFKMLAGSGDYRARALPRATPSGGQFSQPPYPNPNPLELGAGGVRFSGRPPRIAHQERIGPVMGSTALATAAYRIQPGQRGVFSLFPWASQVAQCFQQYVLHGMVLSFVSCVSPGAGGAAGDVGTVMMATQYDPSQPPLASEQAILNQDGVSAGRTDTSFVHSVECAPKLQPVTVHFVRGSNDIVMPVGAAVDDVGLFQISVSGCSPQLNGQRVGDLWVSYDLELLKPTMPDVHVGTTFACTAQIDGDGEIYSRPDESHPDIGPNSSSSLPCEVMGQTNGEGITWLTVKMPPGYPGSYQITVYAATTTGSVLNAGALIIGHEPGPPSGGDITELPLWRTGFPAPEPSQFGGWKIAPEDSPVAAASMTFTTIAESPVDQPWDWITVRSPYTTTEGHSTFLSVIVTALDNDLNSTYSPPSADEIVRALELVRSRQRAPVRPTRPIAERPASAAPALTGPASPAVGGTPVLVAVEPPAASKGLFASLRR